MLPARLAPLTSIRFFAAVWVVAFHSYLTNGDRLAEQHPRLMAVAGPLVRHGDLAVDLFFMLSGFVLGWNYLARLGPRLDSRTVGSYVRMRFARIYPLYLVVTLAAGALIWVRYQLWHDAPVDRLTWGSFLRQLLMVQQWTSPGVSATSWSGPAWSISAEWLAYLSLPLLALVVWRVGNRLSTGAMLTLSAVSLAPVVAATAYRGGQAGDYTWLLRVMTEFTAGLLLAAALGRVDVSLARRTALDRLAVAIPLVAAAWFWLVPGWRGDLALVLWLPFLGCLAFGDGPVTRLLSRRPLVVAGQLSFALYLVHGPVFKLYREVADHAGVPTDWQPYGEMLVACACVGLAWLLMTYVEEPARRRLTRVREVRHALQPV